MIVETPCSLRVLTVEMDVSLLQATLAKLPEEFFFEDSRTVISSFCGVDMLVGVLESGGLDSWDPFIRGIVT